MAACARAYDWYIYIAVALVTFFGGLLILIPCRVIWYFYYGKHHVNSNPEAYTRYSQKREKKCWSWFSKIRAKAINLAMGRSWYSKLWTLFIFLTNMVSICIYFEEVTMYTMEDCGTVRDDPIQIVYMACCGVFIIQYIIRFVAATDKTMAWIDVYSIVDHFTIGPTFVGLYYNRNWIGLRFLRLLYILVLPEVLQYIHVLKTRRYIRLFQMGTIFFSMWLTSSGFAHLIVNSGDPWGQWSNATITYWMCVYWLLVTMSTVGYGEISPENDITRIFICIFIMGSFAMFSSIIPELVKNLGSKNRYKKPYKRVYGKRHIVVCGYITYEAVHCLIKNLVHEDAGNVNKHIVFIDNEKPSLELEAFLKRNFSGVTFYMGTVMDIKTLHDVKLLDAEACLIMANRSCEKPDEEDGANIMRATAIKNFHPNARIIIQLLQHKSKANLLHIPNWNWGISNGDDVICISELKMGIMAQNCMAPGIATLFANLFTMRSIEYDDVDEDREHYMHGVGCEIYVEQFGQGFKDVEFSEAVEYCFSEFGIVLIALQDHDTPSKININPIKTIIREGTTAFFIAQAPEEVRKVRTANVLSLKKNKFGMMNNNGNNNRSNIAAVGQSVEYLEQVGSRLARYRIHSNGVCEVSEKSATYEDVLTMGDDGNAETFDQSGTYHWCPSRTLEEATINIDTAREHNLKNHILVCLLSRPDSPHIGLYNFILPLRSSTYKESELKDIVIFTRLECIAKEWEYIKNFPRVYVYEINLDTGSRGDLRAANILKASMCVVLSPRQHMTIDSTYIDKDSIIATLSLKNIFTTRIQDTLWSMQARNMNPTDFLANAMESVEIPVITELEIDSNVAFLDQEDDDDPDTPLYQTQPYVCGRVLADSTLDSLMSVTLMDSQILDLVRCMVTGTDTPEFEHVVAAGLGVVRKSTYADLQVSRNRSMISQLSLENGFLKNIKFSHNTFGELFVGALKEYGIICLGLYRILKVAKKSLDIKRFVISSPPADLKLKKSDKVYCLVPHDVLTSQQQEEVKAIEDGDIEDTRF